MSDTSEINIPTRKKRRIQQKLMTWYEEHKRDLPWRRSDDPYRILLSEFMLQQTRVDTVIPYFHHFLERFPTLESLAEANQSDVLKAWEGLGYYARARNLHRAAKQIVVEFGGEIPQTYNPLSSLSGFGPYTTAAVLSIAFNQDYAVLDGNVIRVFSRLFGIADDITQNSVKKRFWALARELLPEGNAATYNQGLMELGALVCHPRKPECVTCPLTSECTANKMGSADSFPVRPAKKTPPHHTLCAGIVWRQNRLLIARRLEEGLLGGLWEFPVARRKGNESFQACCVRAIREETGVEANINTRFRTVKHAFTHFRVTIHSFVCTFEKGKATPLTCSEVAWVPALDVSDFAFSRANRKLLNYLIEESDPDLFHSSAIKKSNGYLAKAP